jgi:methionyl-tRNA formyltransferase
MDIRFPRIVFMGTPEFAVPSLKALCAAGYPVVGVITAPTRAAGRGLKPQPSAVALAAMELGLPLLQPEKLKDPDFLEAYVAWQPDLNIVVAFRMLPKDVWAFPKLGTFNLHGSLLPHYRGAAPIQWAVMNGETETGLTTFLIDEAIDTGHILLQEKLPIGPTETAGALHDRMMEIGANLVVKTVEGLGSNHISLINQSDIIENQGLILKMAPKIHKEDGRLLPTKPGQMLMNQVRGLNPFPGAYLRLIDIYGEKFDLKVWETSWLPAEGMKTHVCLGFHGQGQWGLQLTDGFLAFLEIQAPGRKRLKIKDFLLGAKIEGWKVAEE